MRLLVSFVIVSCGAVAVIVILFRLDATLHQRRREANSTQMKLSQIPKEDPGSRVTQGFLNDEALLSDHLDSD